MITGDPQLLRSLNAWGRDCRGMVVAPTLVAAVACAVTQKPVWSDATVDAAGTWVTLTLAKPAPSATPPKFLVVFASGDGGLSGISAALLEHLGQKGHWVAGFSSEEAFENVMSGSDGRPNDSAARDTFLALVAGAKRALNLREQTPIIATGMSRGANVVIVSAGDAALRAGIIGAVAIALTREFDELIVSDEAKKLSFVKADDRGRLQTYPAIARLGAMPLAIIQSTHDDYVPSAESRRLLGPDTPTRRLYEVNSTNHEFDGGHDALMRGLDDAINWIAVQSHN